jgi:outer membrane protein assembly factor BamB
MNLTFSTESTRDEKSMSVLRRWYPAVLLISVSLLALYAVQADVVSLTGKPSRDILLLIGATELAFYVWIRVFSSMRLAHQALTLILFVGLQSCAFLMARLDGFTGDGRPILVWRWSPTPEQLFDKSRTRRASADRDSIAVDLTKTTEWDCPAFRGADRSGRMKPFQVATDWGGLPPKQLWKQPIGRGWSSFAVVGNYCVTQEQRREDEVVVCYELRTGREVWVHRDPARFDETTGGAGPRATPTIHNGFVYTVGATGVLNCLDGGTGKRIWSVDILKDNKIDNRLFGMAGSPLVVGPLVVVSPGGMGSSLAAYDLKSGRAVWKGGDAAASYSSPQLAPFADGHQVLSFNAEGLSVHDPQTGQEACRYPWVSNPSERNNVCQPVPLPDFGRERIDCVFISSGYGKGCALLEIRRLNGRLSFHKRWGNRNLKAKFSSVVIHEGCVYGLDGSILTCIDLNSGRRHWKAGRYGYGQLSLVGSTLLIQLESGEIALVNATSQSHQELARFGALDGRTWNHPVLAGRHLLVRNDREAACFELHQ